MDGIPFKINNDFTIDLSEARKLSDTVCVGQYLVLNNVIDPETEQLYEVRLRVIPDGGYNN